MLGGPSNVTFHSPEGNEQYPATDWLTVSRPCAQGGVGYAPGCGWATAPRMASCTTMSRRLRVFRSEETMRKFLIHTTVEHQHFGKLLPMYTRSTRTGPTTRSERRARAGVGRMCNSLS